MIESALAKLQFAQSYMVANLPDVLLGLLPLLILGFVLSLIVGWRLSRRFHSVHLQLEALRARLDDLEMAQARRVLSDIRSASRPSDAGRASVGATLVPLRDVVPEVRGDDADDRLD